MGVGASVGVGGGSLQAANATAKITHTNKACLERMLILFLQ
jgi:hypothetical protein